MDPITLFDYSKHRGCSRQAVQKAVDNGRLSKSIVTMANGKPGVIDVELADREWIENTKAEHRPRHLEEFRPELAKEKTTKPKVAKVAKAQPETKAKLAAQRGKELQDWSEEPAINPQTGLPNLKISNQKKAHYEAEAARVKAQAAAGLYVDREGMENAAFDVARQVRDSLFQIPDRLADQLAAMHDPGRIREMLKREFRKALAKLASEITSARDAA